MKKRYAMARTSSAFIRDGIDLSWPQGGKREVVELEEDDLPTAFKMRLMNGVIAVVEDEPTKVAVEPTPYKLYDGDEARAVMAEPAGPVVVEQHGRRGSLYVDHVTLIDPRESIAASRSVEVPTVVVAEPAEPVLARTAHRRS